MSSDQQAKPGNPVADTYAADIKGKVILITGVTLGTLGGGFALSLARAQPALLILAGRDAKKNQQTADAVKTGFPNVKVRTLKLDLISLAETRAVAEQVNCWADVPHIDVLVNNAGVMATDWRLSPEGYESQLAINHLGHFLLTNLLMSKILKAAAPRVVIVASNGHRLSPFRFEDYNFRNGESYDKWASYGQSKTANILMARSLAEKVGAKHKLLVVSLNPGIVMSNLSNHLKIYGEDTADLKSMRELDMIMGNPAAWTDLAGAKFQTPEEGADNLLYAAFDPELVGHNGAYLEQSRLADPYNTDEVRPWVTSPIEADRLWKLSEKLVGQDFAY